MWIVVEDEGVGFNVDAVLQEKDTRQPGIGLFSIRERLAALDGDMAVEQIAESGTRVQLRVPLTPPSDEEPAVQSVRLGPMATRSQPTCVTTTDCQVRVLVVDDHTIVREGIANVLRGDERLLVVGEAADGVEAIQAMEHHQPDVVLIDVNMPRMNGVEATREIRRRWPDVRIVALSVQDDAATARTMLRVGADTFVSKSDAPDQMIHAVLAPSEKP